MAVQADWLEKDLYAVLGVAEDADSKTISRAYRKLARELHPDTHPDDPAATERFKGVTAAYDVLGDETKRAEYDEFRRAVAGAGRWDRDGRRRASSERGDFGVDDEQAWTTFDSSAWTTVDPDDLDDLLSSMMGRSRPSFCPDAMARSGPRGGPRPELRGRRQRPHDRGDPQ